MSRRERIWLIFLPYLREKEATQRKRRMEDKE